MRRDAACNSSYRVLELRFALEIPDVARGLHPAKIEEVRRSHPHTVTYCDDQPWVGACLPYALGLRDEPAYLDIAAMADVIGLTGVFFGTSLADWLLDGRLIEINQQREGALVLYFKYELWVHAGKVVRPNRVQSKWGLFPVYQHETWEVPCQYGDRVRYFEMPPRGIFREYAASKGITL